MLKDYQKEVNKQIKDNGWEYWSPLSILARLTEEVGEFARLVNHVWGSKPKKDSEKDQDLEEEMADIIYTLICFANSQNLDLDNGMRKTIDRVAKRDKNRYNK